MTIYGVEKDFKLGDIMGETIANDGIMLVGNPGHLVFASYEKLPEKTYYWYLPEQFTGNQVCNPALLARVSKKPA